jgi:hypothetical protein
MWPLPHENEAWGCVRACLPPLGGLAALPPRIQASEGGENPESGGMGADVAKPVWKAEGRERAGW